MGALFQAGSQNHFVRCVNGEKQVEKSLDNDWADVYINERNFAKMEYGL